MDNPGISLFQGTDIQINNSKNIEEEEDLEDQLRRKEELQNLLQANLDDFKYDDSTINSSANVSLISADNLEQLYKDAISPNEQLKVLYDVRCREIQSLKEDYDKFKTEKTKEIESQKHQNLLLESELRQLSISLKNSENLLVERTETLNSLGKSLHDKESQIIKLEKLVKDYENDLATYKSEISEMHLKLQSQNGPFNLNAKYNSEELRKSLQVKIEKLENAFDEQAKKFEICNTEKQALQDEIERLALDKIDLEKENDSILKNLDNAQQQCKDLIEVIEVMNSENNHFKGRLNEIEGKHLEHTLLNHTALNHSSPNEKLKKMLVDKSVELDSLKTKLRHYEADLKELIEYRQLKGNVYKKEFQQCDNHSHTKELILMQNELQNYRRIIDDKNQQILSLNSNNTDLKEKIEEMLLQTRNEIQNISSKYNMPQLEIMRKELEKAEYTEKVLSRKLEESEERRLSLLNKLKSESERKGTDPLREELGKCRDNLKMTESMLANEQQQNRQFSKEIEYQETKILQLKNELEELKVELKKSKSTASREEIDENTNMKSDYEALKLQLKNVMEHLEKTSRSSKKECPQLVVEIKIQMDDFLEKIEKEILEKGLIEEQINSWKKLLDQIEVKDPDGILKSHYQEAVMNLHASEEKLKDLQEALQDLQNTVTLAEGEKCSLSVELKELAKRLHQSESLRSSLQKEISRLNVLIKERDDELINLRVPEKINGKNFIDLENSVEGLQKELKRLNEQLDTKEHDLGVAMQALKQYEQEKKETRKWFEKMKNEIERLKSENIKLENELQGTNAIKNGIKISGSIENDQDIEKENKFKTRLEEEIMSCELKLRDELHIEYQKRISDIEKRYQKTFKETTQLCKQQKLELEEQDKKFREYLKMILSECEACTVKLENEKMELTGQLQLLANDFEKHKIATVAQEEKYICMLKKKERDSQKNNEAWKIWSKKVVCSCLDIEATNKKVRERVLASMERYDHEVAAIQKLADAKVERKSSKKHKK